MPGPSEQARLAFRRALEETQQSLTTARAQAEAELRRRWELLRDAVEQALSAGMSLDDVARWLGLAPSVIDSLVGPDAGFGLA